MLTLTKSALKAEIKKHVEEFYRSPDAANEKMVLKRGTPLAMLAESIVFPMVRDACVVHQLRDVIKTTTTDAQNLGCLKGLKIKRPVLNDYTEDDYEGFYYTDDDTIVSIDEMWFSPGKGKDTIRTKYNNMVSAYKSLSDAQVLPPIESQILCHNDSPTDSKFWLVTVFKKLPPLKFVKDLKEKGHSPQSAKLMALIAGKLEAKLGAVRGLSNIVSWSVGRRSVAYVEAGVTGKSSAKASAAAKSASAAASAKHTSAAASAGSASASSSAAKSAGGHGVADVFALVRPNPYMEERCGGGNGANDAEIIERTVSSLTQVGEIYSYGVESVGRFVVRRLMDGGSISASD